MKLAILFSGQGSQFPNMGIDLINNDENILNKVKHYETELNLPLLNILGDTNLINDTRYTQPAMVLYQILKYDWLIKNYDLKINGTTGFSLGEFSSFYASKVYDDLSVLKIINKRALLMQEDSKKTDGMMAAVIGLDDNEVIKICNDISTNNDFVEAVNFNSPGQIVISGSKNKINEAIILLKEKGAKRAIPLNVSGPFHSKYMNNASKELFIYLNNFNPLEPLIDLYANTNAQKLKLEDINLEIKNQIKSPVYFKETIINMIKDGYTHFLEIGPGNVLNNLIKRIDPNALTFHIDSNNDLLKLKEIF